MSHHYWRLTVFSFLVVLVAANFTFAGDERINPRVWSAAYWQKLIDEGVIDVPAEFSVPPAVFTGSEIKFRNLPPVDGPDVAITSLSNTTQSENSVFAHPGDNNKALNSNNSTNRPVTTIYGTSRFFTMDFGATWGGSILGPGGSNSGDPACAIALDDDAGEVNRYYINFINTAYGQGISWSDDEGATWVAPVVISSGFIHDKNHMWTDNSPSSPYEGNIYAAWTDFTGGVNNNDIVLKRSTTKGVSWGPSLNLSNGITTQWNQGVHINTGPNGEVYVVWSIYDSAFPSPETAIGYARSLDGGVTFSAPVRIVTGTRGIRNLVYPSSFPKNQRMNSFPTLAVDISGGPNNGNMYVFWCNEDDPASSTWDINVYMSMSVDGGTTWSARSMVNTDAASTQRVHYLCWGACDPATGDLSVIYYDDRNLGGAMVEAWVSHSSDAGATWEDFKVSDVAHTPTPIPGLAGSYYGDYLGISARGGKAYPVWTDNRMGWALAYTSPFDYAAGGGMAPVVSDIPDRAITPGTAARYNLDDFVADPDNLDSEISWTFSGQSVLLVGYRAATRQVKIKAPPGFVGPETITFTATDPDGNIGMDDATYTAPSGRSTIASSEVDEDGYIEIAEIQLGTPPSFPAATGLLGNYPNPFNPTTTIRYGLNEDSQVALKVYNTLGQEIATLVSEYQKAGYHSVSWNGKNEFGQTAASGVYIYRLTTGNTVVAERMLLSK